MKRIYYQVCCQGAAVSRPLPQSTALNAMQQWQLLNRDKKYRLRPVAVDLGE